MIVDKENSAGYDWGKGAKAWTLLNAIDLSVKEECIPAGAEESFHKHEKAQQFFYILDGEACMLVMEPPFSFVHSRVSVYPPELHIK
jgi:oxalate decarboxylase/phosphoglucose isomerase-like protein (cupin superfamily)